MGQLVDNSMVLASEYNDPMGGVAPMEQNTLGHMSSTSYGGAKKKSRKIMANIKIIGRLLILYPFLDVNFASV